MDLTCWKFREAYPLFSGFSSSSSHWLPASFSLPICTPNHIDCFPSTDCCWSSSNAMLSSHTRLGLFLFSDGIFSFLGCSTARNRVLASSHRRAAESNLPLAFCIFYWIWLTYSPFYLTRNRSAREYWPLFGELRIISCRICLLPLCHTS